MQMLCEWAQIKGQPWEERVAEWLQDTGCDAWVMKGLTQDPEEYAQHRITRNLEDPSQDAASYAGYMSYYRHRGVEAIHDGLIVMRRREGQNWVRIEEVPTTPKGELGEMIVSTFAAHDLMQQNEQRRQAARAAARIIAATCAWNRSACSTTGEWRAEALTLRLISGFPFHMDVQPLVAEFLVTCDGNRTAGEAIQALAAKANAPVENGSGGVPGHDPKTHRARIHGRCMRTRRTGLNHWSRSRPDVADLLR